MQVATSTNVFLFDLEALCGIGNNNGAKPPEHTRRHPHRNDDLCERFDRAIGDLLASEDIVKLGFSFDQDIVALRRSWPLVNGFRRIVGLLEVGDLSEDVLGQENSSLTKLCEAWLGKPLDKTECTSKWEIR